jgi:hypothetical protein
VVSAYGRRAINYNAPVSHSQVQQGSPHAVQTMTISDTDKTAIADFIDTLKGHSAELRLDASAKGLLGAEIQIIETQVTSPSLNRQVVHESLHTIRNLLEGCAGSLIASGLFFELGKLLN